MKKKKLLQYAIDNFHSAQNMLPLEEDYKIEDFVHLLESTVAAIRVFRDYNTTSDFNHGMKDF